MGMCVAYGCNNRKKKKDSKGAKISFHRFPCDPEMKEKWIQVIKRGSWEPSNHSRICSDHFTENDYDTSSPFRRYLRKDAVPSIFASLPPHLQPSTSTPKTIEKLQTPKIVLKSDHSSILSPIMEKNTKTILEITTEKLEKSEQALDKTKKKLRNVTLQNKRLLLKVANLKGIINELHNKNRILSEHAEILSNVAKHSVFFGEDD